MKRLYLLLMLSTMLTLPAQVIDLIDLARGESLGISVIENENGELFGYASFYKLEDIDEENSRYKVVFLDKNLNEFLVNEFDNKKDINRFGVTYNNINECIIAPNFMVTQSFYNAMAIDLETNTMKEKTFLGYENGEFKEVIYDMEDAFKLEKGKTTSVVRETKTGYFVMQYTFDGIFNSGNYNYMFFDKDKNKKWEIVTDSDTNATEKEVLSPIDFSDEYVYFIKHKGRLFGNKSSNYFTVLDIENGNIVKEEELTYFSNGMSMKIMYSQYSDLYKTYQRKLLNNVIFTDRIEDGFYKFIIDKENLKTHFKTLIWKDINSKLPMNKKGKTKDGYYLMLKEVLFHDNGGFTYITEKTSSDNAMMMPYKKTKSSDMVLLNVDKDFKLTDVQVLEKEKSKGYSSSDYLFSQPLNNGKDMVFYFADYKKDEKKWNLYINTIIDGKLKQEVVPITSKENSIVPYKAKEGYILLREYNHSNKYNQIRLERLNF